MQDDIMADDAIFADGERETWIGVQCRVVLRTRRAPISIHSLSPRSTAPYQMLTSEWSRTRPITDALSATQ